MNKRQKKKREKKILLWTIQDKPKIERYGIDFNYEGYRDSTAAAAIRNVMAQEKDNGQPS